MENIPTDLPNHPSPKRILIAPLNWGLGHATRCIPVIQSLLNQGAEVFLASDGAAFQLLKAEFPQLPAFQLPSYRITYSSGNMVYNMAKKLPRILFAIRAEQWETQRLVHKLGIHAIISDNRYGCFCPGVFNVMITHQLHLRIPGTGLQWAINRLLHLAFQKFDAIWVPDAETPPGLAGTLAHGKSPHKHIQYTGILSRMQKMDLELEYDLAVVLSGPEPQRTWLEQRLLEQLIQLPCKSILIRGKTHMKEHYFAADHVEIASYLTSNALNKVLAASKRIVCRSGYSSIMDLVLLGKKALLIPTPGQTEQEYLAELLVETNICAVQKQENIDLEIALNQIDQTLGFDTLQFNPYQHQIFIEKWLLQLPG